MAMSRQVMGKIGSGEPLVKFERNWSFGVTNEAWSKALDEYSR